MEVEIKEEGKGSQAAVAAEAPLSEEKVKEVEAGVLKMLEFYFGDSNFSWDRFMQSKVCTLPSRSILVIFPFLLCLCWACSVFDGRK